VGGLSLIRRIAASLRFLLVADGILLIPLAALIASAPRYLRGISCGHDFDFHLVSWMEARRSRSESVLYPHWAQSPNWGAGEARFIFYPPLTWMLGAAFSYLMTWDYVPFTLTLLFMVCAGFATRVLARQFVDARAATLAGVLATSTPYALFTAYERSAFGELAAAVWIPLLLLFAWRRSESLQTSISARAFDGSTAPLALVLALTWLTNAPAGVMASYLLAFAAVAAGLLLRSWWPILRATVAAIIGLGLAAFYIVPAAWEQRWIAIEQAVDVGMRIRDSWLFARHPGPDLELHDVVLLYASLIVTLTAAAAALAFGILYLREKLPHPTRHFWLPLALLIPIIVLLQFPVSAPIWNHVPKLQFLQFPWRWLAVLGVPYAIFLAAATPLASRWSRFWSALGWTAVLLAFAAVATLFFFQYCDEEDEVRNQLAIFQAGTGVEGTDEYAPVGSDNTLVASGLPDACLVEDPQQELGKSDSGGQVAPVWYSEQGSCDGTFSAQLWQNEHKLFKIDSDHEGYLVLRLRRYPAWRITVDGNVPAQLPVREDGLVVVPIDAGPSIIEAQWTTTQDVLWGRRISLVALLVVIALWFAEQRAEKRRLTAIRLSS
jgi:hypothetical protein